MTSADYDPSTGLTFVAATRDDEGFLFSVTDPWTAATPVVDLYALTNPQHTPWAVPHRVLSHDVPCKYCYRSICPLGHHRCLRGIEPASVVAAALALLSC